MPRDERGAASRSTEAARDGSVPPMDGTLTIRRADVELAVEVRGPADAPTLVFVHGYPDTRDVWRDVAARLSARFRVVTYDVRGAGASTRPARRDAYGLAHLAADLRAVIEATSAGRPAHVIGHDWGAIQSWELVTEPDARPLLASFTSISGPCLDHVGRWLRGGEGRAAQLARSWYVLGFQLPAVPEAVLGRLVTRRWSTLMALTEGIDVAPSTTLAADARCGLALYRANFAARLAAPRDRRTDVPVQVVVPLDDRYVGPAVARTAVGWASELVVREIVGGHWVVRRSPERISRLVAEHVDRVEGRPTARDRARRPAPRAGAWAGRLVVVTGAASGIGRATALAAAERGAGVVIADRDRGGAEQTASLCRRLGADAYVAIVDVADVDAVTRWAAQTERDHGVPDVVVNNAGIGVAGSLLAMSADDWRRVVDVNVSGVLHGCRLFGAQMVARGEGGHIVNVASAAAFAPSAALPAYSASKAAVLMLSECLRAELARHRVGVSAICPGLIDTPITQATTFVGKSPDEQARLRDAAGRLYRRRGVGPEQVARAILRAVDEDLAVVPVTAEAHAMQLMGRWLPGVARRLARFDALGRLP